MNPMRRRPSLAVAGLLVAAACGGCGSTVQARSSFDVEQSAGMGSAPTAVGSLAPVTGVPAAPGAVSSGTPAVPGSGDVAPVAGGAATAPVGTTAGRAVGVTGGSVAIGYTTSRALSGLAGSLGLSGVDAGDTDAQVKAVVADLNARGGLLGRKVVLKAYDAGANSSGQQVCTYFTQDQPVFALVDAINLAAPVLDDSVASCLNSKHIPVLTGAPAVSRLAYDRFPYLVAPDHAASERYMAGLVDQLVPARFFDGWDSTLGQPGPHPVKIGINSFDTPGDQSRVKALRAALHARGYDDVEVVKYSSDLTALPAATSNAVLRFKADGVTHVFSASVLFYQDAQSQAYHPRYAVDDTANTVQLMAQNAPKAQLHAALGAGYLPMAEDDGYSSTNAAAKRCMGIMTRNGIDVSNRFAVTYMLNICDRFWTLERALAAGGAPTPAGFLAGIQRLPRGTDSAGTYAITLSTARRDGAYRLQSFGYVDSCSCFRLTGRVTSF
jgi:ABC-type branched-subunit amino acid transport system substrate-binding protein